MNYTGIQTVEDCACVDNVGHMEGDINKTDRLMLYPKDARKQTLQKC